jgi:ribonuclease HI
MSSFYAIAVGEKRGVFTSWNDCKPLIENYKGAVYRKFSTLEEATNFIEEYSNRLYVYTDGACINNGSSNARAGIGIYFSKDSPLNVSRELKGEKVTNNIAELTAVIEAINLIKDKKIKDKIIVTDSEYVIKCAT